MLIEFTFENFRAARDEQNFTLYAGSRQEHRATHLSRPKEVPDDVSVPDLLHSAVIYGANASGKSNLIMALAAMREIVAKSASWGPDRDFPVTPFLLSSNARGEPTSFELIFVAEGVRYQYGFSLTAERVIEEWLYAFPKGRAQHWFSRELNAKANEYKIDFGDKLLGEKDTWRRSTRPNALLLSTAVQLNSEQLLPVYRWFTNTLQILREGHLSPAFTLEQCLAGQKAQILQYLQKADFAIVDLEIDKEPVGATVSTSQLVNEFILSARRSPGEPVKLHRYKVTSKHRADDDAVVPLDIQDESGGTRRMLALAGPWLDVLSKGSVLFVDELHESLHPELLRYLVQMFHDPEINKAGAQLVFTTHNTSILNQDVFRRDQIWFCERQKDQASNLYPLTDFHPRKAENLERAYLGGRYGALPILRRFEIERGSENGET